jgi:hypothetical protein
MNFEATLHMPMYRRQARRLTATMFVVFALLFSQLALANFVCASQSSPAVPAAASGMDMAMAMAPDTLCEEMGGDLDKGQPVLCHQHCTNAPQSVDPFNVPTVSPPAVLYAFVVPLALDAGADESAVHADLGQFRPPPDPVFLSTLRLRV